jgi:hypothetical protein
MSHGAAHGAHGEENKKIAILIAVLALFLAVAETFAKGAQTNSIAANVEASNLWAFFQAKTIRQTTLRTAADQMTIDVQLAKDAEVKKLLEKRVSGWLETAQRYQSEPETNEGRDQLAVRAKAAEAKRDLFMEKYHHYEVASALFQIAIVLASVFLLTKVIYLLWASLGLAAAGVFFSGVGLFAPSLIHLF